MLRCVFFVVMVLISCSFWIERVKVGEEIDRLNGVSIYFNGDRYTNVFGRSVAPDGYNFGLKYQCVEFVKRYYYEVYKHKMPNTYGHAKDLFDVTLPDSAYNAARGLMQFRNVREYKPKVGDIIVYDGYKGNPFGHVAIISKVNNDKIEIVQQNMQRKTRISIPLVNFYQYWTVADYDVLGWLRKK